MQKKMKVTYKNSRRKRIKKLEPAGSRISRRKLKRNKEYGRTGRPRRGNSNHVQLYLHLKVKKPQTREGRKKTKTSV
jgi:hypothetical protein